MPPFLLGHALGESFHQLFPAAQRFDQPLVLFAQGQLGQFEQPLQRHLGTDHFVEQGHQSLEVAAEYLIEAIE